MSDADRVRDWNAARPRLLRGHVAEDGARVLSSRCVAENAYSRVHEEEVEYGDGSHGHFLTMRYAAESRDGVIVVPVDRSGRIHFVRQFRPAMRTHMVELPRGFSDGEPAVPAAVRELLAETGHAFEGAAVPLGRLVTDSGKLHDAPHVVAGTVVRMQFPERGGSEPIRSQVALTLDEALDLAARGYLCDTFTVAALLRVRPHLRHGILDPDPEVLAAPPIADASALFRYATLPPGTARAPAPLPARRSDIVAWARELEAGARRRLDDGLKALVDAGLRSADGAPATEVVPADMEPSSNTSVGTG